MNSLNIFFAAKNTVETHTVPIAPPKAGQLLIETRSSVISTGTECIALSGNFAAGTHWDNWVKYPFQNGYLNAGIVVEVGEGVEGFAVGDRVASRAHHHQYVLADANRAIKIPEGVSEEDAAWFGLACIVQIGVRRTQHELGDSVVVIGAGLLGQLTVQYLRLSGAKEIIVVDTAQSRLDLAAAHGATRTLAMPVQDVKESVLEATDGRGADVVYDITGHPAVFSPALGLARRFGKLLLLGDAGRPEEQRLTSDVITRGVQIIGSHDGYPIAQDNEYFHWTHTNMARLFFTYLERGQMNVSDLVTHRYSPKQAAEAYEMLLTDRSKAMGVVFDWTQMKSKKHE
jgi:2-desacetyl-2-hydroxyethyl bacteriochlorophyllide A dehydrogenase